MSEYDECIEIMKRIESTTGNAAGKMQVRGTIIIHKKEVVHSSLGNSKTLSLSRSLDPLTAICNNCIRCLDPMDKAEFIKVNFSSRDENNEVMCATDDDFLSVVVQDHPINNLREALMKGKLNQKGYKHDQQNFFFPSIQ